MERDRRVRQEQADIALPTRQFKRGPFFSPHFAFSFPGQNEKKGPKKLQEFS